MSEEHKGQHKHGCGACNGWRYDRAKERRANGEDSDRVVAPDSEWNWKGTNDTAEVTDRDARFANKVLERGFKGSQKAYVAGIATPGQLGVTNFIVALLLAEAKPALAKRILRGMERGAGAASGKPAELFERELREHTAELIRVLESEDDKP